MRLQLRMAGSAVLVFSAASLLELSGDAAQAGGFAIREQSAQYQGMSYAGSASGGALSSIFWNPAATAILPGLNTESAYTIAFPDSKVTVTSATHPDDPKNTDIQGFPSSTDIGRFSFTGASYGAYRLSGYDPNLFVGFGFNSPFGLDTKPDNPRYQGAVLGRTAKLQTYNLNPTIAYRIAPGVILGAGVQIQSADTKLRYAAGSPGDPSTTFRGDDVAFGATAGILLQPTAGTSIGLGWRSRLNHDLEGDFGTAGHVKTRAEAELKLPDIVTLSLTQAVAPNVRLLGTVEWTNWSRFESLRVEPADVAIAANWNDGWFFALGGEYDHSERLTLRAGVAYEISPVDSPQERIITVPDADRVWLSAGASYRWSETTTIDLAYTHAFFDDARFDRTSPGGFELKGETESDADIFTVGLKMKWGGEAPLK